MNLNRILINESEKQRILGLHSKHKSLITEQLTKKDFPICVRNAGTLGSDKAGNQSILVYNAGGKGINYQWYSNQVIKRNGIKSWRRNRVGRFQSSCPGQRSLEEMD